MSLPGAETIYRRRFRTDSYEDDPVFLREPRVLISEPKIRVTTTFVGPELKVPGGSLFLTLGGIQGKDIAEIRVMELLDGLPNGTRLYWFTGRRSIDGRRKRLSMRPPTTHRIEIPGLRRKVYVKKFSWKDRYLVVG